MSRQFSTQTLEVADPSNPSQKLYFQTDALVKLDATEVSRLIQTSSSFSGVFGTSTQQVDFVINQATDIHVPTDLYLLMNVSNSGVTGIGLLPSFFWFSNIQWLLDSQVVSYNITSEWFARYAALWYSQQVQTQEPLLAWSQYGTNLGAGGFTAGNAVVLGSGSSAQFILPLRDFLGPVTSGILFPAVQSEFRLRLYFDVYTNCVVSTSSTYTGLSLSNVQISMNGIQYGPVTLQKQLMNYASGVHIFPTINQIQKTINIGSLSSGSLSGKFVINSPLGFYCGVLCYLLDLANTTPESRLNPIQPTFLQYFDSSGSPINFETSQYQLIYSNAEIFCESLMWVTGSHLQGAYYVPFCVYMRNSLKQLMQHGARQLIGTESVQITPSVSLTNGQLNLFLYQLTTYYVLPNRAVAFRVRE